MIDFEKVDIKENKILKLEKSILLYLLKDHTTKQNIIWATDNYKYLGNDYEFDSCIEPELITGINGNIIKPRVNKSSVEQQNRIRKRAEVFTHSWICNHQNNLLDEKFFHKKDIFNIEIKNGWNTNPLRIKFSKKNNTWQDYVKRNVLEITCGEAPYLVSRYDSVSGKIIPLSDRIGLLDRKLRIIKENVTSKEQWIDWVIIAYKSTFGYEWQGDNLLLARENLLYTFRDYYFDMFNELPSIKLQKEIAKVISWNLWQMDGLKYVIPNSCEIERKNYCMGCKNNNIQKHNGIYCKIKNWETGRTRKFVSFVIRSDKK